MNVNTNNYSDVLLPDAVEMAPCGIPTHFNSTQKTHLLGINHLIGLWITTAAAATAIATSIIVVAVVGSPWIIGIGFGVGLGLFAGYGLMYLAIKSVSWALSARKTDHLFIKNIHKSSNPGNMIKNNHVAVTKDAEASLHHKLHIIRNAQTSIEISANYLGGNCADLLIQALIVRLEERPELKVHLLVTPDLMLEKDFQHLKYMIKKYKERFQCIITPIKLDLSPQFRLHENHVKIVVVDEKYFVFGGSSIQDFLSSKGDVKKEFPTTSNFLQKNILASASRDHDIVGYGPIAKVMRRDFFKLFEVWEYKTSNMKNSINRFYPVEVDTTIDINLPLNPNVSMQFLMSFPETGYNPITQAYKDIIENANSDAKILIGNMYFDPDTSIMDALKQKKNISIITNGYDKDSSPLENIFFIWSGRHYNYTLLENAKIYEYQVPKALYHTKAIAIQGKNPIAGIGSYNFGKRSHYNDHEAFALMYGDKITENMTAVLESDIKLSKVVTEKMMEDYQKSGPKYLAKTNRKFFSMIT